MYLVVCLQPCGAFPSNKIWNLPSIQTHSRLTLTIIGRSNMINPDYNIREIQFGPYRTNPNRGSKQILIPHRPKCEMWLGRNVVSWKICGVVLVVWWETASSQLCHRPQCLGLGKFERWWFVRKFPPHHGQPAICLHPATATSQPSPCSNISVRYICQM